MKVDLEALARHFGVVPEIVCYDIDVITPRRKLVLLWWD